MTENMPPMRPVHDNAPAETKRSPLYYAYGVLVGLGGSTTTFSWSSVGLYPLAGALVLVGAIALGRHVMQRRSRRRAGDF